MTAKKLYPFVTRREIQVRLDAEPAFVSECALVLQARSDARQAGSAVTGKASGWMSSEKAVAGRLVAKLTSGVLTEAEDLKLKRFVSRYTRQLAEHHRALALREDPGLSEAAARFGVLPPGAAVRGSPEAAQAPGEAKEGAEEGHCERQGEPPPESERDEALAPRVLAFLRTNAGQRAEEIARAVGTTTAMLAPTLRELVQGKKVMKRGVGRGTRYFSR